MPGTDGFAGYVDQVPPTGYIDNQVVGTHAGQNVMRQRTSTFEATGLVPYEYDEIDLTYNTDGTIATAVYKKATTTVATLTLGYTSGSLTSAVRT